MALRDKDNEELPYRSAITRSTPTAPVTQNEHDYSTLENVRKQLTDDINDLHKDFNAFKILEDADPEVAAKQLLIDVRARQIAYDILAPALEAVDTAIKGVDINANRRNQ